MFQQRGHVACGIVISPWNKCKHAFERKQKQTHISSKFTKADVMNRCYTIPRIKKLKCFGQNLAAKNTGLNLQAKVYLTLTNNTLSSPPRPY